MKTNLIVFILVLVIIVSFTFTACNIAQNSGDAPADVNNGDATSEPPSNEAGDNDDTTDPPVLPQSPEPENKIKTYVKVLADGLNVRLNASTSGTILGQVNRGELFAFVEEKKGYYKIFYRNDYGYLSADGKYTSLCDMQTSDKYETVITYGEKLLGTPYVYGATRLHNGAGKLLSGFKVGAFDCSSLMQYMFYYGADVNLGMTSRDQSLQGTGVNSRDIERGTVLFFTNSSRYWNTGIERVGHVGIYLGNNYILHTASDYAQIELISEKRWSYYLSAKNMY